VHHAIAAFSGLNVDFYMVYEHILLILSHLLPAGRIANWNHPFGAIFLKQFACKTVKRFQRNVGKTRICFPGYGGYYEFMMKLDSSPVSVSYQQGVFLLVNRQIIPLAKSVTPWAANLRTILPFKMSSSPVSMLNWFTKMETMYCTTSSLRVGRS
jgi:hypothetical protein